MVATTGRHVEARHRINPLPLRFRALPEPLQRIIWDRGRNMVHGKKAGLRAVLMLIFAMLASFAVGTTAFAQAGSTGGTIGKTDKSISGEERGAEPNKPTKSRSRNQQPTDASARSNVFVNPTINGIRVDRCMKWGPVGCGDPGANHWCRSKGFQRATSWSGENVRPTIFQDPQSSVKVCDYFFCGGFTRIVCE